MAEVRLPTIIGVASEHPCIGAGDEALLHISEDDSLIRDYTSQRYHKFQ